MKIAILSDIHANLEAFEVVSADLLVRKPDAVICLGDLIGYGPDPERVVKKVAELGFLVILGNHEAAFTSRKAREWMNFQAKENNMVTEAMLSEESLAYCRSLPRSLSMAGACFVHGFPPDSVMSYVYLVPDSEVVKLFATSECRLYFVGHTHELALISQSDEGVVRLPLPRGRTQLDQARKYIVNAGSVGQPRDSDNRAKYLIWDSEFWALEVIALPYAVEVTMAKIQALGFPDAYADRLR